MPMMLFLMVNIIRQRGQLRFTQRERPVAHLPFERMISGLFLDPHRTCLFHLFDKISDSQRSGEIDAKMHVISYTARAENLAAHIPTHSGQIGEQSGTESFAQQRFAMFR